MNIHKNFLPQDKFITLQSFIMSDQMPWYYNDGVVSVGDSFFQFTFGFVSKQQVNCSKEQMTLIEPILSKIKYKKLNKVKANLLGKTNKNIEHGMHTDQLKGKTGIFYINNCNGYTKFENGEKIYSEENKYIEFNSKTKHSGSSCTDKKIRVVINFNYE
tara:strand:- start:135 stop:611 length:477 start_codon:yes stop_codon:yes gene_type:complete